MTTEEQKTYRAAYYRGNKEKWPPSNRAYKHEWYIKNKEGHAAKGRAWQEEHKESHKAYKGDWFLKNRERCIDNMRATHLKREYGLTVEEYDSMLEEQGGVCKICKAGPGLRRLCVDHCHKTGTIRGLLCTSCNVSIGRLQDSPILLRAAADYLES